MSGIAPKQNAFKFNIAPHKQKSIVQIVWQEDEAPWPTSTPQHNGKSGRASQHIRIKSVDLEVILKLDK